MRGRGNRFVEPWIVPFRSKVPAAVIRSRHTAAPDYGTVYSYGMDALSVSCSSFHLLNMAMYHFSLHSSYSTFDHQSVMLMLYMSTLIQPESILRYADPEQT